MLQPLSRSFPFNIFTYEKNQMHLPCAKYIIYQFIVMYSIWKCELIHMFWHVWMSIRFNTFGAMQFWWIQLITRKIHSEMTTFDHKLQSLKILYKSVLCCHSFQTHLNANDEFRNSMEFNIKIQKCLFLHPIIIPSITYFPPENVKFSIETIMPLLKYRAQNKTFFYHFLATKIYDSWKEKYSGMFHL